LLSNDCHRSDQSRILRGAESLDRQPISAATSYCLIYVLAADSRQAATLA